MTSPELTELPPSKQQRRDAFQRVKQAVVALAHLKTDLEVLASTPSLEASKHIDVRGTAFLVDDAGIAATAYHVVERHFERVKQARLDKKPLPPRLYYISHGAVVGDPAEGRLELMVNEVMDALGSEKNDLALLQLAPVGGMIPRPLVLSTALYEEGDELGICGWPFGLELHEDRHKGAVVTASFAPGLVSAVLPHPGAARKYRGQFQIAAQINSGNSGGPVFDPLTGEVLGIVLSAIEREETFRAEVPIRDEKTGEIVDWKMEEITVSVPSGIARAAPIHLVAERIPEFIRFIEQKAARNARAMEITRDSSAT